MKSYAKLLSVFLILIGLPAIAAEASKPTFPIWGGVPHVPVGYYNAIKSLSGQEFVGATANCFDGGASPNDTFVLRGSFYDASTGVKQYDVVISADTTNFSNGSPECSLNAVGQGIALSGTKRIIFLGMQNGDGNAVVKGWNAETGAEYFTKSFPLLDVDGFGLEINSEASSVGNFISTRSDQLRVGYVKDNGDGSITHKITYYDVLTGNQIGSTITIDVAAPPTP